MSSRRMHAQVVLKEQQHQRLVSWQDFAFCRMFDSRLHTWHTSTLARELRLRRAARTLQRAWRAAPCRRAAPHY